MLRAARLPHALAVALVARAATASVEIGVHARVLSAGEPVRIEVAVAQPLASLTGRFLDQELFFVPREAEAGAGERWSAWSLVPLEQRPGPAAVEVVGHTVAGETLAGRRPVTIEPRTFPEELLSVEPRYVEPPAEVRERLAQEQQKVDAVYASRRRTAPPTGPFVRPVSGEPTSPFGTRRVYNGKPKSPHPGIDLRAATGTPVRCAGPGRVVLAQDLYYSGNTAIVDHGGGLFTIYAHLSALHVTENQDVEAGALLGLSGATGRVTGPHLHWGAKIGKRPFDPTALLEARLFD
jgi:murein DD-endopeptidase MepM/ murein hydrolase activator NlpD